ncbi:MAG: hypothetical protein VKP57_08785 [Candidatus Sericytochromatia bacterium]|nr:hypothetical protein [Candidatus Sericytochromatia bacterium]
MASGSLPKGSGGHRHLLVRLWAILVCVVLAGCVSRLVPAASGVQIGRTAPETAMLRQGEPAGLKVTIRLPSRQAQTLPGSWASIVLTLSNANTSLLPSSQTITRNQAGGSTVTAAFTNLKSGSGYAINAALYDGANASGNKVAKGNQAGISLVTGNNEVTITLMSPVQTDWRNFPDELYECGSVIYVEGHFEAPATVNFVPSGATTPLVVLSSRQAYFEVPCNATTGTVSFTDPDGTSSSQNIRIAEFSLGLTLPFSKYYNQATLARTSPILPVARAGHGLLQRGQFTYVLGGASAGTAANTVYRSLRNADGTMQSFATTARTLVAAREGAAWVNYGGKILAVGGQAAGTALASTETSTWQGDNSPGAFTSSQTMGTTRAYPAAVVIGDYVYVFGGESGGTPRNTIERAPIDATGNLTGGFSTVTGTLVTARSRTMPLIFGGRIYLIGGRGPAGPLASVESAPVNADGSIGSFSTSAVTLQAAREGAYGQFLGTRFIVIGGRTTGNTLLNTVESSTLGVGGPANFATVSGITLRSARAEFGAVVNGDGMHVIGGTAASGTLGNAEFTSVNQTGNLSTFSAGTATFTPRFGNGAAVLGASVNVFGGCGANIVSGGGCSSDGSILSTIERATIDSSGALGSFASSGALDYGRVNFSSGVLGTNLWIFAGGLPATAPNNAPKVIKAPVNDDGSIGTFTDGSLSVAQVSGANAITVGTNLYLLGGLDGNSAVSACRTGSLNSTTYDIGGFGNNGPGLVTARARMGLVVLGSYIYAIGGQSDRNGAALASIERCAIDTVNDEASGNFTTYANSLNVARAAPALVVSGNKLYVIGGTQTSSYTGVASVEVATIGTDGSLGTFSIVPGVTLGTARGFEAAALVGNYLQLFGGLNNAAPLGSTEQAGLQ